MQPFDYLRAADLAAARAAVAAGARPLAGGQSLLAAMKLGLAAPSALVDLQDLAELRGVRLADGMLRIGALTTHDAVACDAQVHAAIPALAALAGQIGDQQVRHRGTLGGSLAQNDPAACYPAAVLALGATVHTERRDIAADEFFRGLYETALDEGELITAVSFPRPERAGWVKLRQPASRYALVGVFVARGPRGVRVAVTGAGPCVFRVAELERRLAAEWSKRALEGAAVAADGLTSDMHGPAAYRAALIPVLARRALAAERS